MVPFTAKGGENTGCFTVNSSATDILYECRGGGGSIKSKMNIGLICYTARSIHSPIHASLNLGVSITSMVTGA